VKYAARGKYVPKLLCFALVKSWCESRDKRIKRSWAVAMRMGMEFTGRGKRNKRIRVLENDTVEEKGIGSKGGGGELVARLRVLFLSPVRPHLFFSRTYFLEREAVANQPSVTPVRATRGEIDLKCESYVSR